MDTDSYWWPVVVTAAFPGSGLASCMLATAITHDGNVGLVAGILGFGLGFLLSGVLAFGPQVVVAIARSLLRHLPSKG